MNQQRQRNQTDSTALTVVQPPRLPHPPQAAEVGIHPGEWSALVDSVFPSAKSVGGVMLAIRYCQARKLDIFKRPVHVVPMWNSALGREVETVWPGIGEYRTTASRTGAWAGNDDCVFGPTIPNHKFHDRQTRGGRNGGNSYVAEDEVTMDYPEWAQITVYKMVQGQRVAFVGPKVRFMEIFSGKGGLKVPNDRWQRAPWQMLEKCAEAAALRRAFPDELGDTWSAEEMEGKTIDGATEYAEFTETQAGGAAREPEPTRKSAEEIAADERADEMAQFWQGGMEEWIDSLRNGLAKVKTEKALNGAVERAKEALDMLPEDERANADRWIEEARARVTKKPAAGAEQSDDAPAADEAEPSDEDRFARYVEQLEGFAKEASGAVIDVNSLKSREKTAIGQLSAAWQARANIIMDVALDVAKNGGVFDEKLDAALTQASGTAGAAPQDQ